MYKRCMAEAFADANNHAMLIWEMGQTASGPDARFHMLDRFYSFDSLTDLSGCLRAILEQIKNYRTDLAAGYIDDQGNETEKGKKEGPREYYP